MTLKEEIIAKCTSALIATRNEAAIADVVNVGRTKIQKVDIADVQAYLQENGLWLPVKAVAANTAHAAYTAALALVEASTARFIRIDTSLPIVAQMLGGLVAAGVMTEINKSAIIAMSVVADPVSAYQVAVALQGV